MLNVFLATNGPWYEKRDRIDANNNEAPEETHTILRWVLPQSVSGRRVSILNCSVVGERKYRPIRICCNLLLDTDFNPEVGSFFSAYKHTIKVVLVMFLLDLIFILTIVGLYNVGKSVKSSLSKKCAS